MRSHSLPDGSIADMGEEAPPGFEPGNNGFADRDQSDATSKSDSHLQPISNDLPTDLPTDKCRMDPMLAEIVDSWDRVPEAIKAGILAMVKAAASP